MDPSHRHPGLLILAIVFGLSWLVPGTTVRAEEEIFRYEYPDHPDTHVKVLSVFAATSRQGALPYRVTIRNHSGKTRLWTIRLSEGNYARSLSTRATYQFKVENGTELVTDVALSFAPAFHSYDYRNLEIEVSAPGLPTQVRSTNGNLPVDFPLLAISRSLGQRSITRLDEKTRNLGSNVPYFAKLFTPEYLPREWSSYTGLDGILLDQPAYEALAPAQKQALTAWIRLGGELHLFREDPVQPAGGGGKTEITKDSRLSLGRIHHWTWDGRELPDGILEQFTGKPVLATALESDYDQNWPLQQTFGTKDFNPLVVFLLLFLFAVLVAPVNLFYFAKPGRRHRLFVTTPLISVVTCVLIVLVILFMDGVGGRGFRVVIADLQPGEGRIHLLQEQISRTGVMVTPAFETDRSCELNLVNLPPSHFNPLSNSGSRLSTFEVKGKRFDGEFFRSRSEQGFAIRSAEPSRERIETQGVKNGAPQLISNLSSEIISFRYRDDQGGMWIMPSGSSASPGQSIPLEESKAEEEPAWITGIVGLLGKTRKEQVKALYGESDRFFAEVANPGAIAIATHPWIQWDQTHVLLTGTPSGNPPSATE